MPHLAIRITGGIGDYIVAARFIRDLRAQTDAFTFDLFCVHEAPARWIFSRIDGLCDIYSDFIFDDLAPRYVLAMHIAQSVNVWAHKADWTQVRHARRLTHHVGLLVDFHRKHNVLIHEQPRMDNLLALKAVYANASRCNFLHHVAGIKYGGDALDIPGNDFDLGLDEGRPHITIHNGFDPGFVITNRRATKCYPHFDGVVKTIKAAFPGIAIVQVGTRTSVPIKGADVNLIDRTSLQDVASVIANAVLHVDNEGGLVHLARCLGVTCCVVFGPTPADYFGYEANINVTPHFCGGCWWINDSWMDLCPRKFPEARCLSELPPEVVGAKAVDWLRDRLA